ncbi:MAG: matrixin family metalloprotease [Chitinophagaceae bacterium]|nr:matrixin family metalloprotease [Chitinophagaceae bacterium]
MYEKKTSRIGNCIPTIPFAISYKVVFLLFFTCICASVSLLSSCNDPYAGMRFSRNFRETHFIELQPFEYDRSVKPQLLSSKIRVAYGFRTIINPELSLPNDLLNFEKGRRYDAPRVLKYLKELKSDSNALIVGITSADIYTSKRDRSGKIRKPEYKYKIWGIFGLATCPGNSAVISTKRIKHPDGRQYEERIIKIILHEIGHNLGLKHCSDKKCLMTDAVEKISTIDNASSELCRKCSLQIGE